MCSVCDSYHTISALSMAKMLSNQPSCTLRRPSSSGFRLRPPPPRVLHPQCRGHHPRRHHRHRCPSRLASLTLQPASSARGPSSASSQHQIRTHRRLRLVSWTPRWPFLLQRASWAQQPSSGQPSWVWPDGAKVVSDRWPNERKTARIADTHHYLGVREHALIIAKVRSSVVGRHGEGR
jgi:hypothetical protein